MIEPGKAVEEVWKARDSIWEDIKALSPVERADYFRKKGENYCKKYGLKRYSPKIITA